MEGTAEPLTTHGTVLCSRVCCAAGHIVLYYVAECAVLLVILYCIM